MDGKQSRRSFPRQTRSTRIEWFRLAGSQRIASLLIVSVCLFADVPGLVAAELHRYDSLTEALSAADTAGKPVLAIFTGSDWCPPCKSLERKVLSSQAFKDWAEENVVVLEIDMPQKGITAAQRSARSEVCRRYGVSSYPTVMILQGDGQAVSKESGYGGQSAPKWIDSVKKRLPGGSDQPAEE